MVVVERARHPAQRPLVRRDADRGERTASNWESLTERLIREAQEEGHFDDLPGHGRPLELDDDPFAGDMAMAHHVLRNAGAAPPWIETDKEVRAQRDRIESLLTRATRSPAAAAPRLARELDLLVDAHDEAVRRLEGLAPTVRQQRPRLDRARLRERLRAALDRPGEHR
jgi:hypothetical protein